MCIDRLKLRPIGWRLNLAPVSSPLQGPGVAPKNWHVQASIGNTEGAPRLPLTVATYLDRILEVRTVGGAIDTVEVNLPRLLHDGGHGDLIKTSEEMEAAFRMMWEILGEVSKPLETDYRFTIVSIELGWNFRGDFDSLAHRLRLARNPFGHRKVAVEPGREVIFRSSTGSVKIYAKTAVMRSCGEVGAEAVNALRFEVTLKRKRFEEYFGKGAIKTAIPFETAYQWLRECVSKIEPRPVSACPVKMKSKLARLCAEAARHSWTLDGEPLIDFLNRGVCAKTALERRRLAQTYIHELENFSWETLFPAAHPPPPVEIPSRTRKTKSVQSCVTEAIQSTGGQSILCPSGPAPP